MYGQHLVMENFRLVIQKRIQYIFQALMIDLSGKVDNSSVGVQHI